MKFDFDPGENCKVRVLTTLPDHPIARLEGRNGIGKTMAIRLLQLCTGDQPYRRSDKTVWRELRQALGAVSIRCTQLEGAGVIEWEVDASLWPDEPEHKFPLVAPDGGRGICRSVRIDGTESDLPKVQELLRVYRLAGDETLAQGIEADVSAIRAATDAERSEIEVRADRVLALYRSLDELLTAAAPATVISATKALTDATKSLADLSMDLESQEARQEELKSLARQQQELEVLVEQHGDPEVYVRELESKVEKLKDDQEQLRNERDSLKLDVGRDAPALDEIDGLEQRLIEKRSQRDELLTEAQDFVMKLDLLSIPPSPKEPAFKGPEDEAKARLEDLLSLQADLDSGPQVSALGDRVLKVLTGHETAPIQGRPLVTVDAEKRLSPKDLEAGIRIRQQEIVDEGRPPQAEQLEDQIRVARERLEEFSAFAQVIRKIQRRDTEIRKARERLKELTEGLAGVEGEKFAELENRQQELAQSQSEREGELRRVLQQMHQLAGGDTAGTLLERFERRVSDAEVSVDSLRSAIEEQSRQVTTLIQERERAALEAETAEAALSAAEAAQKEALSQMAISDTWEQLRGANLLPLPNLEPDVNQGRIDYLWERGRKLEEALDSLSTLASEWIVAGVLAAERREKPQAEGALAVLHHLEATLGKLYFGHSTVAEALFDGGHLLRFDLLDQVVEWQPEAAEAVTRHLDAFSSGERAFAYTKTRLERLRDEPPVLNRFIALDEFGAFLERSRLELLEEHLAKDVIGKFASQALIILPLAKPRTEEGSPFVTQPYFP